MENSNRKYDLVPIYRRVWVKGTIKSTSGLIIPGKDNKAKMMIERWEVVAVSETEGQEAPMRLKVGDIVVIHPSCPPTIVNLDGKRDNITKSDNAIHGIIRENQIEAVLRPRVQPELGIGAAGGDLDDASIDLN